MTNGDKIRNMSDEELARFLDRTCGCSVCFLNIMTGECASFKSSMDCITNKVKWLKHGGKRIWTKLKSCGCAIKLK